MLDAVLLAQISAEEDCKRTKNLTIFLTNLVAPFLKAAKI